MSTDALDAQIVAIYDVLYTTETCTYAVLALIVFEYALTFRQEVDMFWNRKLTGATALFLLNRYLIIIFLILGVAPSGQSQTPRVVSYLVGAAPTPSPSCAELVKFATMFEYLVYLPWAVFAAMRAYALAARRWPIGVLVLILGLVPFAVNVAVFGLGVTGIVDPIFGCEGATTNLTPELAKSILFILNTLHLIFTLISIELSPTGPASFITIFTNPLTCILVSRFLLDLQGATRKSLHLGTQAGLQTETADARTKSTIVFERVVGSIASTLEPRSNDSDDTVLEEDRTDAVNDFGHCAEHTGDVETKF
ncbi:hypothetical protein C8T65DRAFT_741038 [Cerioporus squamosus]|nr:hypothetical protein C8T65DRAFT_741038 [Cerioporus squamosus]